MLKLLFYLNLLFLTQYEAKSFKRGHLTNNDLDDKSSWQGLWFPHPPNFTNDDVATSELVNVADDVDFEIASKRPHANTVGDGESWQGLWFPKPSGYENNVKSKKVNVVEINKHECDNGKVR